MTKLKKNLTLQIIYQILATITPLITAPYLSRKLGADALGIYSYTYSIINYFMLIAMLGFINYGTRTIATSKTYQDENKNFWSIYYLQIIFSTIATLLFIILFLIIDNEIILLLQIFWLISCFFDITWYFFGKEKFNITVTRNIIIKIITIIAIFIFVKNKNDLYKYVLIMSLSNLFSHFLLWLIAMKNVKKIPFNKKEVFFHLKEVFILFIPVLAMSIYHIMDKTMLGFFSTSSQSGFYYNADKVVNIPLCIFTGIGTVMLANISSLISKNKIDIVYKTISNSIKYILCLSIAMGIGLAAISDDFVPLFFGSGYDSCILLIKLFSIVIIIKSLSDIIRTQYMIPFKQEKLFIISVFIGAIVNFICNFIFIYVYKLGAFGATIGTIIAEFVVLLSQMFLIRKRFSVIKSLNVLYAYIPLGCIMYVIIKYISSFSFNNILKLIIEILFGGIIYLIGSFVYLYLKKDFVIIEIINKFKKLLLRREKD